MRKFNHNFLSFLLFSLLISIPYTSAKADLNACKTKILNTPICKAKKNNLPTSTFFFFSGNKQVSNNVLNEVSQACFSQSGNLSALIIRQKISELYSCMGYLNSGALFKSSSENSYHYKVIEGTLKQSNIRVTGTTKKEASYIKKILTQKILNVNILRYKLDKLEKNSQFKVIKSSLYPIQGKLGQAGLDIKISKIKKTAWHLNINNHQNSSIGKEQISLDIVNRGLLTVSDSIFSNLSLSKGSKKIEAGYHYQLDNRSHLTINTSLKRSKISDNTFKDLDIKNSSKKFALRLNKTLLDQFDIHKANSSSKTLNWQLGLDYLTSQNELLGRNFSFAKGEVDGRTRLVSIANHLSFHKKMRGEGKNYALATSVGLEIGESLHNKKDEYSGFPDKEFMILTANSEYKTNIQLLRQDESYITSRVALQYSRDQLFSAKKIELGGFNSIRGVKKNIASFDTGARLTTEVSTLLPQLNYSLSPLSSVRDGNATLSGFADYGIGKNNGDGKSYQSVLALGMGMKWKPLKNTLFAISYAKPVAWKNFDKKNNDINKNGILYFNLSIGSER